MGYERSQLEDQLLVMDAQDGNIEAMSKLVHRWQKRLWQHALRLTGDQQAAWDVTQSAWYDIIRRLQKLHDTTCFTTWAYKITTCKAIDWIKKKCPIQSLPPETLDTFAAKQPAENAVDELLKKLDIKKRAILYLYYFEELSVAEISEVMAIPAGTVKSRLHAARNELKILWEKETRI